MSFDIYDKMKMITCPTLIIHGENDPIPNTAIKRMAETIQKSELHIVGNCGHFVHIENPKKYFQLIKEFISKYH